MVSSRLLLAAVMLSALVACAGGGRIPGSDPGALNDPALRDRRIDEDRDAGLDRGDQGHQPLPPGHALPIENGGDVPSF